jgi:ketosteroid isomerase-like protein
MNNPTIDDVKAKYAKIGSLDQAATNIEKVRQAYVNLDSGNVDGFFADFAEDVVAYEADGLPYAGVFKSLSECRRLFNEMMTAWSHVQWDVKEFAGGGDIVVVAFDATFTARKSGKTFKMPILELWRFREGKVVELRPFYYDTHYIREAFLASGADSHSVGA